MNQQLLPVVACVLVGGCGDPRPDIQIPGLVERLREFHRHGTQPIFSIILDPRPDVPFGDVITAIDAAREASFRAVEPIGISAAAAVLSIRQGRGLGHLLRHDRSTVEVPRILLKRKGTGPAATVELESVCSCGLQFTPVPVKSGCWRRGAALRYP